MLGCTEASFGAAPELPTKIRWLKLYGNVLLYIYIYTHTYLCAYIYINIYAYVYIHIYIYIYNFLWT